MKAFCGHLACWIVFCIDHVGCYGSWPIMVGGFPQPPEGLRHVPDPFVSTRLFPPAKKNLCAIFWSYGLLREQNGGVLTWIKPCEDSSHACFP